MKRLRQEARRNRYAQDFAGGGVQGSEPAEGAFAFARCVVVTVYLDIWALNLGDAFRPYSVE